MSLRKIPPSVADIEAMDRAMLSHWWGELLPGKPPHRASAAIMQRVLAFEVQARRYGGLSKSTLRQLNACAKPFRGQSRSLQSGGRLIREWNGVEHVVEVLERGFRWRGENYRSLSAVAKAITGAHWSGPRFFGLQERGGP